MPPPFTHQELKAIQEGHRRNADVMDLLREVKRLRDLVALAHSVLTRVPMQEIKMDADEMIAMFDAMRAEPAVRERIRVDKKREELEFRRRQARERNHVRQDQTGSEPG